MYWSGHNSLFKQKFCKALFQNPVPFPGLFQWNKYSLEYFLTSNIEKNQNSSTVWINNCVNHDWKTFSNKKCSSASAALSLSHTHTKSTTTLPLPLRTALVGFPWDQGSSGGCPWQWFRSSVFHPLEDSLYWWVLQEVSTPVLTTTCCSHMHQHRPQHASHAKGAHALMPHTQLLYIQADWKCNMCTDEGSGLSVF